MIISSVRRNHPGAVDPAMKSCNLINNILAMREAQAKGALEPLMLNEMGEVAEGAGSNVFLVAGGRLADAAAGRGDPARDHPGAGAGAGRPRSVPSARSRWP